jgi:hypothetical protein
MSRQTFAAGDTIRLAHLEAVARMNAEITTLRARVEALEGPLRELIWGLDNPEGLKPADVLACWRVAQMDGETAARQALQETRDDAS